MQSLARWTSVMSCVFFAVTAGAQTVAGPNADLPSAVDLLKEAYLTGAQLVPANRCRLLLGLARAAVSISPPDAKAWAEESFTSSQGIPKSWERAALQKNALEILAHVEPAEAFDLLASMDEPVAEKGVIPEDLRAFVAGIIYPSYWASQPSPARLEKIQSQARAIAANGEYPFQGVLHPFEDLSQRHRDQADAWWEEIVGWYARGSRIRDADSVFVSFLKDAWKSLAPPTRRRAIEITIKQLMREPESTPGLDRPVYQAIVTTSGGRYNLTSPGKVLVLKLLPEIHEAALGLLSELGGKEAVFRAAQAPNFEIRSINEALVFPKDGSSALPASSQILAEQQLLARVAELAPQNPSAALQVAVQLSRLRDDAFSAIGSALHDSTPSAASALADTAARQLQSADNKDIRLQLLALEAQASQVAGGAAAEAALKEGISLGEDMFEEFAQSHPASPVDEAPPLDPLRALVSAGMRLSPWNTVGLVRHLGDPSLRAWLLIEAALGRGEAGSPGRRQTESWPANIPPTGASMAFISGRPSRELLLTALTETNPTSWQ